ncbi:hypothetical protein BDF19DRAFT_445070, partial [Syncephalis fuscata]
ILYDTVSSSLSVHSANSHWFTSVIIPYDLIFVGGSSAPSISYVSHLRFFVVKADSSCTMFSAMPCRKSSFFTCVTPRVTERVFRECTEKSNGPFPRRPLMFCWDARYRSFLNRFVAATRNEATTIDFVALFAPNSLKTFTLNPTSLI